MSPREISSRTSYLRYSKPVSLDSIYYEIIPDEVVGKEIGLIMFKDSIEPEERLRKLRYCLVIRDK